MRASPESVASTRVVFALCATGLAILAVVAFLPASGGPLLLDDRYLVAGDPRIQAPGEWRRWFTEDFWNVPFEVTQRAPRLRYWRPAVTASYALDYWRAGGPVPRVFHSTNFALGALVAVLHFALLRALAFGTLASVVGTLAVSWHPTRAESIAWISGRTDLLCAIGVLLTLVGDRVRARVPLRAQATMVLGACLAFMSKETAVVLPALILGVRAIAEARGLEQPSTGATFVRSTVGFVRANLAPIVAFGTLALTYGLVRRAFMPIAPGAGEELGAMRRLAVVFESFGRYVELAFVPHDVGMLRASFRRSGGDVVPSWPFVGLGFACALGILAALVRAHRRRAWLGMALLFAAPLAPCINLVPTGLSTVVAPRFVFLSLLALAVAIGLAVEALPRPLPRALLVAGLPLLGLATFGRASDFAEHEPFWDAEARSAPHDVLVHRARIALLTRALRYREALAEGLAGYRDAALAGPRASEHVVGFVVAVVEIAAALVPDRSTESLGELARFAGELRRRERASPLIVPALGLRIELESMADEDFKAVEVRVGVVEVEVLLRLGRDDDARAALAPAIAGCSACGDGIGKLAFLAARLGDAGLVLAAARHAPLEAERLALEELAVHTRRDEAIVDARGRVGLLYRRRLFGRALRAFEEGQFAQEADSSRFHAELLARSGFGERARARLEPLDEPKASALVEAWTGDMGWGSSGPATTR